MEKIDVGQCLLSQLLESKKMHPTDLVCLTGISKSQLSDYMHNRRIMSLRNCKTIANALNVHMDDLYEWYYYKE